MQHHRPQDQIENKSDSPKLPVGNGIRAYVGPAGYERDPVLVIQFASGAKVMRLPCASIPAIATLRDFVREWPGQSAGQL